MEVESPCRLNIDLAVPGGTAWNSHEIALDSGVSGAVVGDPAVGDTALMQQADNGRIGIVYKLDDSNGAVLHWLGTQVL